MASRAIFAALKTRPRKRGAYGLPFPESGKIGSCFSKTKLGESLKFCAALDKALYLRYPAKIFSADVWLVSAYRVFDGHVSPRGGVYKAQHTGILGT